jgi:hypothetical protein
MHSCVVRVLRPQRKPSELPPACIMANLYKEVQRSNPCLSTQMHIFLQGSHMAERPPSSPGRLAPEHARAHVAASPTRACGGAPPRSAAPAGAAVPASVRAAQRLAAAAGPNAAAAATAATARAQRHSRVVRSDPGGQPPAGTAHSPALRATEHRVPHPRPSAPGSPAARSVRRRLGV